MKFSCQPDRYILYKSPEDFDVYKVIYLNSAKKAVRRTLGKVGFTKRLDVVELRHEKTGFLHMQKQRR